MLTLLESAPPSVAVFVLTIWTSTQQGMRNTGYLTRRN
ncbi:hypothetical protein VITU102760_00720 [Vibrio tubiashii]